MTRTEGYDVVTQKIIDALDQGIVPWHRPWTTQGGPKSLASGEPYRGVNVWTLHVTAMIEGYDSPYWVTFKQAKDRGGSVRKGQKGTQVVLWKPVTKKPEPGTDEPGTYMLLRHFTVFNTDQCDGLDVPAPAPLIDHDPIASAEQIARGYLDVEVKHGGDRAYYSPALDYIGMPQLGRFETPEHYYSTLFHEQAHSTGHASRLNRASMINPQPFGSEDYSREELVAEMAAAFICGEAGIGVNVPQHAAYIASWLKALKDDRKLLVQAAAAAQKAADYVLGVKYEATRAPEQGACQGIQTKEPCRLVPA